ncbi:DNA replication factor Cdt1-like [Homarus americanus]|uniref:DNA replication factor Cdt1-like n=1 Tax=Homarus americanus TaxID=6706 RepID=A0A8J5JP05_HOMAM|nr:DNA replication factor Cdt1-like [Homarus americanus]
MTLMAGSGVFTMAATQTDLHQFFKARKGVRETNLIKNGKGTPPGVATKKGQVKRAREAGTQDIKVLLGKVAAKTRANEKVVNPTPYLNAEENSTPPVTPKRKRGEDEDSKRKKRKQIEEDGLNTPEGPESKISGQPVNIQRSAKKKLNMGSNTTSDKLTPEEIKERLGKCRRLDELRARLLKVNQCSEKLQQFKESTISDLQSVEPPSPCKRGTSLHLKKFTSVDVEIPISPCKTPLKTPVKAPAYERFQHLVEKPSDELVLPYKYRLIKEVFRAIDTVVSLLHNRQEVITYSKLKPAVQEMLRRAFQEKYLGQIKTVFPLAYIFKQESNKYHKNTGARDKPSNPYELTVTANLAYKPSSTQNLASRFDEVARPENSKFRKMDSIVMVERRNIFHNSLVDILRNHHDEFLQSLDPPIISSGMNIKRWHPSFPLEDMPDIEEAPLPQPPIAEKFETARDILDKAQDLFSVNSRMEKAMKELAAKTPVKVEPAPVPVAKPANIAAALKGIRAREAAQIARDMTRSSGENKELEMLSRLPEISRIMRNIFITEKKAALSWEVVAAKVTASYSSMLGANEVDSHLNLLIKVVPGWCTVHKVRNGIFLKINKNEQLSKVMDKLESAIKQRR